MREEVTGGWRKLHNEGLHDLYCLPDITMVTESVGMKWEGHVACVGEKRKVYRILVGICEENNVRRLGHRQEEDIEMDLEETE
jgi:hypothetical protein